MRKSSPLLLLLAALAACDERPPPPPSILDAAPADAGADAAPDLRPPDATPTPDAAPDLVPLPDLSPHNVLHSVSASGSALTLRRIKTDGTGLQTVGGVPAGFDILGDLDVTSPRELASVSRHLPNAQAEVSHHFRGLHLPGGLGTLYLIASTAPARGLLLVKPDGAVVLLASHPGATSELSFHPHVGVRRDGAMIAVTRAFSSAGSAAVLLIRTDGKTFSNGTAICDVTPTTPSLGHLEPDSATFGKQHVYFVGRLSASQASWHYLLRAPQDCSAKATAVTMPKVGGLAPGWVDYRLAVSEDGSTLAAPAGGGLTSADVVVVDDATGVATNVTDSPASLRYRGTYPLRYNIYDGLHLALSPGGKAVAWVHYSWTPKENFELFIRPTDKSAPALQLTADSAFAPALGYVNGLYWASDDALLFAAGASAVGQADLFVHRRASGVTTNLSKTGGTSAPFAGGATVRPSGGWSSPNGAYTYVLLYEPAAGGSRADIHAIDRATLAMTSITQQRYVYFGAENLEAAEQGGNVFFYARTSSAASAADVYVFDQQSAAPATRLTSFSPGAAQQQVYALAPSADGTRVAFGLGAAADKQILYDVEVGPPALVHKLSTAAAALSDVKRYTADKTRLVFCAGAAAAQQALQVQRLGLSAAQPLGAAKGYCSPFALWP